MNPDMVFRIDAADDDLAALAALRWRLKAGDHAAFEGEAFTHFAEQFTRLERDERARGEHGIPGRRTRPRLRRAQG